MAKALETGAKVLAGVGALNWGTAKLLSFDVLTFVPAGIISTVAVAAIGASGVWLLYKVVKKKI